MLTRLPMKMTCLSVSLLVLGACANAPAVPDGPPLAIPTYTKDDPRPGTGGFVRDVRLVEAAQNGTKYILMAWQVGDVLTLGAMTEGPFEGRVEWRLNDAALRFDVDAKPASGDVVIDTIDAPAGVARPVGQTAGFRGYRWTNIELPAAAWFGAAAGSVSLTFTSKDGAVVSLPKEGRFATSKIAR